MCKLALEQADRKRWWNLDSDVNWQGIAPDADDETVDIVETFWAVESFLPDYTSTVAQQHRTERGRAWVHTLWAYEESRHSRALEEWLLRSGRRTEAQLDVLTQTMWLRTFSLPYADGRKLLIYQMLQEGVTRLLYSNLRRRADQRRDEALSDICRLIAADEMGHYRFFRDVVAQYLLEDPEGTSADMYAVALEFEMPAFHLVPDYERRDALTRQLGLISFRSFIEEVWLRSAAHLGVDPWPPGLRDLRDAGATEASLLELLDSFANGEAFRNWLQSVQPVHTAKR